MFSEGDGYEQFMGRWSRRLAPLFLEFAGVRHGDRVLDIGSGTGSLSLAAAAVTATTVTGVEPSAAYVRYATEHATTDTVRFAVGDVMTLPFDDAGFDRTLAMLVLNFVPDPAIALRSNGAGDQARRCRGGLGVGLRRGDADASLLLG